MKTCCTCKASKEESDFCKNLSSPDGLNKTCKSCARIQASKIGEDGLTAQQRRRAKNPRCDKAGNDGLTSRQRWSLKIRADGLTNRQWQRILIGKDGLTAPQRRRARNPEAVRSVRLKCTYGITLSSFNQMLTGQEGACAICKDTNKKWCVDHNHTTGKVRAILCPQCNFALGNLRDSARLATAAAEYLTHHGNV